MQLDAEFCLICQALGWNTVAPTTIFKLMPHVQKSVLASHLQKVRNDISKHYGKVENGAVPPHVSCDLFRDIQMHWTTTGKPLSEEALKKLLQQHRAQTQM